MSSSIEHRVFLTTKAAGKREPVAGFQEPETSILQHLTRILDPSESDITSVSIIDIIR